MKNKTAIKKKVVQIVHDMFYDKNSVCTYLDTLDSKYYRNKHIFIKQGQT